MLQYGPDAEVLAPESVRRAIRERLERILTRTRCGAPNVPAASAPSHRHMVAVWNPSYARSAMDEHLELLLDLVGRYDKDEISIEDVYVWWGKVRSPNRQQPLAHAGNVQAMAKALSTDDCAETHLYLTDYRSLYVAELLAIHDETLPASK